MCGQMGGIPGVVGTCWKPPRGLILRRKQTALTRREGPEPRARAALEGCRRRLQAGGVCRELSARGTGLVLCWEESFGTRVVWGFSSALRTARTPGCWVRSSL